MKNFNMLSHVKPIKTVSIIGLGYIGLPTAAVIAARGTHVVGVDINSKVVEKINKGQIHIVEPQLENMVSNCVETGFLRASTTAVEADVFIIAVPTPILESKTANLSFVMSAVEIIAPVIKKGDLVILESTSPIGTTEKLVDKLKILRPDLRFPEWREQSGLFDVNIAYCPERVLPGKVVEELVSNDRAIGGMTEACTSRAIDLYHLFVDGNLYPTDTRSAELCKLAENAFRDVNIAYANELANVCEKMEINIWEVIRLANYHPRVNILQPGPGVGGHCIAVDPWFIAEVAPDDTPVIQAARHVNDNRPHRILDHIAAEKTRFLTDHPSRSEADIKIACYGIAFKPNIDDLRESPSKEIASILSETHNGTVLVVEPNIVKLPAELANLHLVNLSDAIKMADIHVLLVDHKEFKIDSAKPKSQYIVDVKGIWKNHYNVK